MFAIRNGNPIATILVYSSAYGSTSLVAPKNFSIGVRNNKTTASRQIPKIPIRTIAFPAYPADSFSCPSPSFKEKFVAPPIPIKREIAVHVVDRGNAIFVAAFPSIPTP